MSIWNENIISGVPGAARQNAFLAMHFAHVRHTRSFVQRSTATHYIAVHQSAQTDVSRRTTAMLFTGFIAALIARFYDHQAQRHRARRLQSMQPPSNRDQDEDGPGAGKSGPLARNC